MDKVAEYPSAKENGLLGSSKQVPGGVTEELWTPESLGSANDGCLNVDFDLDVVKHTGTICPIDNGPGIKYQGCIKLMGLNDICWAFRIADNSKIWIPSEPGYPVVPLAGNVWGEADLIFSRRMLNYVLFSNLGYQGRKL